MNKHLLKSLTLATVLIASIGGHVQADDVTNPTVTDVTSTYISNAGFETDDATTASVTIGTNGANNNAEVSNWALTATGWSTSAIFAYNSGYYVQNNTMAVPSSGPNASDATDTKALGLVAAWSNSVTYTQAATLPAGVYTLTAYVYNAGGTAACVNNIGFVTDAGTTYYGSTTSFTVGEWATETVTFYLSAETSGYFSVGYTDDTSTSSNGHGSGSVPHLYISGVKLEQYTYTDETLSEGTEVTDGTNTYTVTGSNLFTNGSFSSALDGWVSDAANTTAASTSYNAWTPTGGHDGGAYINLAGSGVGGNNIKQLISVTSGSTYYYVVYTKDTGTSAGTNSNFRLIYPTDATSSITSGTDITETCAASGTSGEWVKTTAIFTATSNYVTQLTSWSGGTMADGFQLYEIQLASLDYTALNDAITAATTANETYGDVTLTAAIETATALLSSTTATQDDVDAGVTTLNAAVTTAYINYTVTSLKATYGLEADDYKYASTDKISAYTTALNAEPTEEELESYESTLVSATRAVMESNAAAEGVTSASAITLGSWTNALGTDSGQGWTDSEGNTYTSTYYDKWNWAAWSNDQNQIVTLPAGTYLLSVMARAQADVISTFQLYATDNEGTDNRVNMSAAGNSGNIFGNGWSLYTVEFTVSSAQPVNVGVWVVSTYTGGSWAGYANFKLMQLSTTTESEIASGTDVTSRYIANPGFELGNYNGWTVTNSSSGDVRAASTTGSYATTGSEGSYLLNVWHSSAADEDASQTISLPAGTYVLSAKVAYTLSGSGNESSAFAYIYAGDTKQAVDASEGVFVQSAVKFTVTPADEATTADVTIGASRNGWFKADDFHLYYYSEDGDDAAAKLAALNNLNSVDLAITGGQYVTRIFPFKPVSLPTAVTVYSCSEVNDSELKLETVSDPAADTPYLLFSESDVESTSLCDAASDPVSDTYTSGYLTGILTTSATVPVSDGEYTNYVLQIQNNVQAFYKVDSDSFTATQYRAYLSVPVESTTDDSTGDAIRAFTFGDGNATAIEAVEVLDALTSGNAQIYDLNGRKLSKLQKGVNIVNGKKVIVK